MAIIFHSITPEDGELNQERDTNITVSFYDDNGSLPTIIDAYVNGMHAFNGEYFFIPFDGYNSKLELIDIDGYDGYELIIDRSGLYTPSSTVTVEIDVE